MILRSFLEIFLGYNLFDQKLAFLSTQIYLEYIFTWGLELHENVIVHQTITLLLFGENKALFLKRASQYYLLLVAVWVAGFWVAGFTLTFSLYIYMCCSYLCWLISRVCKPRIHLRYPAGKPYFSKQKLCYIHSMDSLNFKI